MLHLHILRSRPAGPALDRCLQSAKESGARVRVVANEGRSILQGRTEGFESSDRPFVTFVDDDDASLLTPAQAARLMALDKPALFTNSQRRDSAGETLQIPGWVKAWSLAFEKGRMCRPHQTIIYQRWLALDLLREATALIHANGWDVNTVDYVMRAIVSSGRGWHYDPAVTYCWNIGPTSHHVNHAARFTPIRRHFFGAPS